MEVVATLLLVAIGVTAMLGMIRLGVRWSGEAMAAATGMATAMTVVADAQPGGRTADSGDADGDHWGLASGSLAIPTLGAYDFTATGIVNGYYVRRVERSAASDVIDGHGRYADVTVDVFWGREGRYVTGLKRRIIRRH
jgi:hypothetical protein